MYTSAVCDLFPCLLIIIITSMQAFPCTTGQNNQRVMESLLLVLVVSMANAHLQVDHLGGYPSRAFVEFHNSRLDVSWKATTDNFKFVPADEKTNYIRRLCGVKQTHSQSTLQVKTYGSGAFTDIPESFDARMHWPLCPSLWEIRDQGSCGSCYAIACAEAATDRLCIQSQGKIQAHLATEDILSCCENCGDGCNGGFPEKAWTYVGVKGVVTGGPWNSSQGCYPYEVRACDHHTVGTREPCGEYVSTPECKKHCRTGYNVTFSEDKHFAESVYRLQGEHDMQKEIMTYGPVEGTFMIHEDFGSYKSGVYRHVTEETLGSHAVKIIGWGVERGVHYWLCANSWGTSWGDHGFFKILRGVNECGIEGDITAGRMKVG